MTRKRAKVGPPRCATCKTSARLTTGAEVYPHRADDIREKPFWFCDGCNGYVGCHPGTKRPLGTPAGPELRRARMLLHGRIDPIWEKADRAPEYGYIEPTDGKAKAMIRNTARSRTYAFLAMALEIDREACHVAMLDIQQCRDAWRIMAGMSYSQIREWAKSRDGEVKPESNAAPEYKAA